jgi:hypothetical protein
MTFQAVEGVIRAFYSDTWAAWYSNRPSAKPAKLCVDLKGESSGYRPLHDAMIISLAAGNLSDSDILDVAGWPIWKTELVHEMLHEYATKVIRAATPCGGALHSRAKNHPLWGNQCGHDDLFYTALCDRASHFGLTPEELYVHI